MTRFGLPIVYWSGGGPDNNKKPDGPKKKPSAAPASPAKPPASPAKPANPNASPGGAKPEEAKPAVPKRDYGSVLTFMTRAMARRIAQQYGLDETGIDSIRFGQSTDGRYVAYWMPFRRYQTAAATPIAFEWTPDPQTGDYRLRVTGSFFMPAESSAEGGASGQTPAGGAAANQTRALSSEVYLPGVRQAPGGVAYYRGGQAQHVRDPQTMQALHELLQAELAPYLNAAPLNLQNPNPSNPNPSNPQEAARVQNLFAPNPPPAGGSGEATRAAAPPESQPPGTPPAGAQPPGTQPSSGPAKSPMEKMMERMMEMIPTILMVRMLTQGQTNRGGGTSDRQIAII